MFLIGDPHLGREFVHNVPLERRGEREAMMMAEFEKLMNASDETTVIVGDLFERPYVSLQTLFQTCDIISSAALAKPSRKIIIMAGNHDLPKETEKRGSFHLLASVFELWANVFVLFKPTIIDDVAYFPWQYEVTALEQVEKFNVLPRVAVGHWDLESFGSDDSHLCPAERLVASGVANIVSGHWHIAGTYRVSGVDVICTGSMQPMTHAEDPDNKLYVTLTADEYNATDPEDLKDKYVRVYVEDGEEVIQPPTCLGFKVEKTQSEKEIERVNLGTFDMNDILTQAFKSYEVKTPVQTFIKENLNGTT